MTNPTPAAPHPLLRAVAMLAQDMLSTLVFVGLNAATHWIGLAVGLAIAVGLAEIGWQAARRKPIHPLLWLSLALVTVFGGATLFTGNPVFALLKPALIYGVIALVLLSPGWMNHYAPTVTRGIDISHLNHAFGFIWAALFGAIATASLLLALFASTATFAWFVLIVPITAKTALVGIQYAATRRMVRRRLRAQAAPTPLPALT